MLHSATDKFGMIAVTPSLESLDRLTQLLNEENQVWQERTNRKSSYTRRFSVNSARYNLKSSDDLTKSLPTGF